MKKLLFLLSALAWFISILSNCQNNQPNESKSEQPSFAQKIQIQYLNDVIELKALSENFLEQVEKKNNEAELQAVFLAVRKQYKKIEFLVEIYNPATAKAINGAPIDEVEPDDPNQRIIAPTGLQVIEEFLFPTYQASEKEALVIEIDVLLANLNRLKKVAAQTTMTDSHIFDAMRLQVFRMLTLGISGFDAPLAKSGISESEQSLRSLKNTISLYAPMIPSQNLRQQFEQKIDSALLFLQGKNFDEFDRLTFMIRYANPISSLLIDIQTDSQIPFFTERRAFKPQARHLFEKGSFDTLYFSPRRQYSKLNEKIDLGKALFFDPILSGDNQRSCSSCHQAEKGFTDGKTTSLAFEKGKIRRNSPTLLNAGLQNSLFYDSRVSYTEDQAVAVLNNPEEMHGSFDQAVEKISQKPHYKALFQQTFSENRITSDQVKEVIGHYIRSLVALNSPFDQYVRGEFELLSENAKRGFNLFMGKAKCGTCHFMPLFNGVVPPDFTKTESEILGVPAQKGKALIDNDLGKYYLHKKDLHRHAFKTTTVRNINLTAPYMHNGVYQTLEEVIDFYNQGGGLGLGVEIATQTLSDEKLNLSIQEQQDLIAFLKSLTDSNAK